MTKLKNTKKGMAKKALSISLVAAMLATSNVPVWAAEFTDGEVAAELFTADEEAVKVVEETPVVEEEAVEPVAEVKTPVTTGIGYDVTVSGFDGVTNNEVVWGKSVTTNVKVTANDDATAGAEIFAIWKDENGSFGNPETLTAGTAKDISCSPLATDTNKKISLYLYAKKDGVVIWSWTSDSFTVKPQDVSDTDVLSEQYYPEISDSFNREYTGEAIVPTIDDIDFSNLANLGLTADDFVIGSTKGDTVNVTDKGVDVYLSIKKTGFIGNIVINYTISPLALTSNNINDYLEATFVTTSKPYTGEDLVLKKTDVALTDRKSKVDLSSYLTQDTNLPEGSVCAIQGEENYQAGKQYNTGKAGDLNLTVPVAEPSESAYKNYSIEGVLTIAPSNAFTISKRSLSSVNVSIPEQPWNSGNIVTVNPADATYTDKTTGETLELGRDVIIVSNATSQGEHSVTVSPATNNTNVEGSTSAKLFVAVKSLANATFENTDYAEGAEEFTGERILKDLKKLGGVSDGTDPLTSDDYTVEFGTNIDAGSNKGTIIIKGQRTYNGSKKVIYFDITPAEVTSDTVTVSEFVEKKDTTKASDYKDAMGLVIKAKNANGKEFTLKEGTDYVVDKYEFLTSEDAVATTGEVGGKVRVTLKATVDGLLKNTNFHASQISFTSTITNAILKSDNIKLKKSSYTYTGTAIEPEFDVLVDGRVIPPTEYRIKSLTNNVNAGTATLAITGADDSDYSNQVNATVTFTITAADASKLVGVMPSQVYTGYSIQPAKDDIHVTLDDVNINVKDNFNVTYGENIKIGEGTIILTPKNDNFTGSKTITFKITGKMLSGGDLKYYDANGLAIAEPFTHTYNGTAFTAAKTVFDSTATTVNTTGTAGKLTEGTDYEIKYVDNIYGKKVDNVQTGIVLVLAKGSYAGNYNENGVSDGIYTDAAGNKYENVVYAETFVIVQKPVRRTNIAVSNGTYAGGLPVKPTVIVNVNGKNLVEGTDYDLTFGPEDRTNVTTTNSLKVTVVPKNGYKVAADASLADFAWGIDKFNLTNAVVTVKGDNVTVKCGRVDVATEEYTVTKDTEANTVTVTANKDSKNYTGSKTITVEESLKPAEKPEAPMIEKVNVVGNKATVILSGESDGATGYDYVISKDRDCITNKDYDKVNKNILATDTTFYYTQQGVYYAYCHAWKRVDGKKVFSGWSNAYPFVVSAITPDQPMVTKVTTKGSTVTVTYTKSANATGYDLVLGGAVKKVNGEMRPVSYGTLVKKVYNGNTVTATFKNVKKGTYYAGLHAYNRTSEDGKKVFSPWSNTKKVTVK